MRTEQWLDRIHELSLAPREAKRFLKAHTEARTFNQNHVLGLVEIRVNVVRDEAANTDA
jgi:hypothetical protein